MEGDIRLVNGANNYQGRIEVCHTNIWGTVCDDSWDINDGIVACRQLGLRFVDVVTSAYFGRGTGQIWLDDLSCIGSEAQLFNCRHRGFGSHYCSHSEDAGLICEGKQKVFSVCYFCTLNWVYRLNKISNKLYLFCLLMLCRVFYQSLGV